MATLAELITRTRQKSDMERTNFVTDDEITVYINESASELYDLIVSKYEDYFLVSTLASITTGNTITLPADFYKLRGVDYSLSGNWANIRKFNFNDRNSREFINGVMNYGATDRRYRVVNNEIMIIPALQAIGQYQIWYVPRYIPLVLPTDVYTQGLDWEEYLVITSAIKCLTKEESDTTALERAKINTTQRIYSMAGNRDSAEPETITNVNNIRNYYDGIHLL